MKTKNKHGRVGIKKPLSTMEKRQALGSGFKRGYAQAEKYWTDQILMAKGLRDLKKLVGG